MPRHRGGTVYVVLEVVSVAAAVALAAGCGDPPGHSASADASTPSSRRANVVLVVFFNPEPPGGDQ